MDRAALFAHGSNAFLMFRFPARPESVFEFRMPEYWWSEETKRKYGEMTRVHGGGEGIRWEVLGPHHARSIWQPGDGADPWDREWEYAIDFVGLEDALDVRVALTYRGAAAWGGVSMLACLRNRMADPFIDPEGVRTFLYRHDGPVSVNEFIGGRFSPHRMAGGVVQSEPGPDSLAHPLMATLTKEGDCACSIAFLDAHNCSGNFGAIHCMHSNPSLAGMQPGETRILRGRVTCIPVQGPADVLARWQSDRAALARP